MRRIEFLINQVRRSTDNTDKNGISDAEIIEFFNDGIAAIQAIIHSQNYTPDMFLAKRTYDFDFSSPSYTLPEDIYSTNALMNVEVRFGNSNVNEGFRTVKRITDMEQADFFGYYLQDNKIIFALSEQNTIKAFDQFRVTYFRQLKRFDKRWATVSSVTPGTPNTLTVTGVDVDFPNVDDTFTIVDANGVSVQSGLKIVSVGGLPASFTFTGPTAGIAANQFVVMGKHSSTSCELPLSVEPHLLDYVRQRLYTRQNYGDSNKQITFTQATQQAIVSIFSNKGRDISEPPIVDYDYLGY
jgi:hypothetical protein